MIAVPILKSSPVELRALQNYVTRVNGFELSKLHTPCYKPVMVKYTKDMKNLLGIEDSDLSIFFDAIVDEKYRAAFKMLKSDITMLLFIGIIYYSRLKKYDIVESLYILLAIRLYANRANQFWQKYCKEDIWDIALKNLSQKHLYKVRNGISSTVLFLASHEFDKNKNILASKSITHEQAIKMIYMLRHRINQSVKSFGKRYYEIEAEAKQQNEIKDKTKENINVGLIANQISDKICTYSQIDVQSFNEAVTRSRIRKDLALPIIQGLSRIEYRDNIKFIILLMSKIINFSDICIRHQYLTKSIVSNRIKINNYSIKDQILEIVDSLMLLQTKSMNKDQITILVSTYIGYYIKTTIC
jgi:hypothetical protein